MLRINLLCVLYCPVNNMLKILLEFRYYDCVLSKSWIVKQLAIYFYAPPLYVLLQRNNIKQNKSIAILNFFEIPFFSMYNSFCYLQIICSSFRVEVSKLHRALHIQPIAINSAHDRQWLIVVIVSVITWIKQHRMIITRFYLLARKILLTSEIRRKFTLSITTNK